MNYDAPEITADVEKKLRRIEKFQRDIKKLVAEVERETGIVGIEDPESGQTWGMHVDSQGDATRAGEQVQLLKRFLKLKEAGEE
jgi:hypothetical protein